jgi:predicted  nucleic acid-binding Zn-ribbon protein
VNRVSFFFFFSFKSEEESNALQKRIQQIEAELDAATEQLGEANGKLEAKEKAAADVSLMIRSTFVFVHSSSIDIISKHITASTNSLSLSLSRSLARSLLYVYPNECRESYSVSTSCVHRH